MAYYNDINNIQNERVKLVFHELIDGLAYTDSSVAIASTNNIEILMAYIIHLEEKIDNLLRDKLNTQSNLIKKQAKKNGFIHQIISVLFK